MVRQEARVIDLDGVYNPVIKPAFHRRQHREFELGVLCQDA
jgi:hypothetical protein